MIRRGRHDASQAFDEAWERRSQPHRGQSRPDSSDAELDTLVRIAELVGTSVDAQPSPQFSAELRVRLMLEAESVLTDLEAGQHQPSARSRSNTKETRARTGSKHRRRVGLAAAAIATVSLVGTAASSSYAAPGNALYPVKRGIESVQLSLQPEGPNRGGYQLERAQQRLEEAAKLQAEGRDALVKQSLVDFSDQASDGADELLDDYAVSESPATMDRLDTFVADSTAALDSLSSDLPADGEQALKGAIGQVEQLASRAADLCSTCSSSELPNLVGAVGRIAEVESQAPGVRGATESRPKPPSSEGDDGQPSEEKRQPGGSITPDTAGFGDDAAPGRPRLPGNTPTRPAPQPDSPPVSPEKPNGGLLGKDGLIPGLLGALLPGL